MGNPKTKNPNYHIMYHGDHMTISYKAYQKPSVQYNHHTLIRTNLANPCTDFFHLLAFLDCTIQADYKGQFNVVPLSFTVLLSLATPMYM